jgi:antitoxin component YwqK of YwqJK toxin-antitoxin module
MTPDNDADGDRVILHRDGSVRARGRMNGDTMVGYWEWYRLDGTVLRSGSFVDGEQAGDWTTYDSSGQPKKVTRMRPKRP